MASEGKLGNRNFFQEEGEEVEEALSLSDLPIHSIDEDNAESDVYEESRTLIKSEDDFYFRPWSTESEICAADDVFFQGQILPMRHSISLDGDDLAKFMPVNLNPSRCVSRSESMNHYGSLLGFTNHSSRSSSNKSRSSSSSSTCSTRPTTARNPKPRIPNQFHMQTSHKPQIRVSTSPPITHRTRKYSIWEFFRFGLLRTPGIELQDLKVRSSVSRDSSSGCINNCICSANKRDKIPSSPGQSEQSTNLEKQRKHRKHTFFYPERILSGCSCSVRSAVKPVPHSTVVLKNEFR